MLLLYPCVSVMCISKIWSQVSVAHQSIPIDNDSDAGPPVKNTGEPAGRIFDAIKNFAD